MTILDALSLIPYWLDMFSATAPYSSSSALAILRTLRIGRVFQAFRYLRESPLIAITVRAVRRSRDAFMLIGMYAALSVLVASSAMFVAERGVFDEARGVWVMDGEVSSFQSIPSGFYWAAITVTTTGYGDVTPRTVWGKIVAGLTAIVGVSIIALPVSIVGSNFMAEWIDYQRHRLKAKIHTDRLLGVLPSDIPPTPGIPAPRLSKRAQLSRLLEQNDAMMQLVSQAQEALNDINPSDAYVRYKRVKEKYSVAVLRIRELQAELAVLRLNNERNAASSTPTGGNGNNDGGSDRGGGGFGQGGGRGGGGGDRRRGPRRIESALSVLPFTRSFTLPSTRAPPMDAYDQQQQSQTIRGGLGPVRTLTPVVDVSGASSSEPGSPLRPVHAAAAIAAPVALSHPAPIARRRAPSLKLAGRGTPVPSPMPSPNAHVAQAHADAPMRGATPPLISLVGSILRPASAASSVHSQRRGTPSRALSPFEGSSGSAATSATATPADLQSMMYGRPLMALARVKSTPDAVALALGEINAEGEDVTKVSRPRAMSMGIIRPLSNLFSRHGSPKSRPRRSMEKNNHRHHRDETVVGMPAPSSHLRIPMSTLSMPDNSVPLSDRSTTSSITSPVPSSYMSSSIAVGDLRSQQQLPPPLFGGAAVPSRTRIVTASTEMPISPHVILFGNGGGTGLLQSPVENSRPVSLMHPSSADDASDHGIVVGGRLSSPTLAHHPPPESH
ncbi:hypothetical protein BC828DRAFT_103015 [Blastocladiella britannica]|nr:hypothetical protein BC828DRAFT_103015 [Blastocladiella britannica]